MVDYASMQKWGNSYSPLPFGTNQPGLDPGNLFSGGMPVSGTAMPYALDPTQQVNPMAATKIGGVNPIGAAGGSKFGVNFDTANLALSGIGTIGGLWAAFKAQQLARDQFNYTKSITNTNLANQIQTYNTALTDRGNNRAIVEGKSPEQTQAYITANSLKKWGG